MSSSQFDDFFASQAAGIENVSHHISTAQMLQQAHQSPIPAIQPTIEPAVPSFTATFEGELYKGTPGAMEVDYFKETVQVLVDFASPDFSPVYVFKAFYANRLFKNIPGYGGIRKCTLVDTKNFPQGADEDVRLEWMTDIDQLRALAKKSVMHYRKQSMETGAYERPEPVAIDINLYPSVRTLRDAIKLIRQDPYAFYLSQMKLAPNAENIVKAEDLKQKHERLSRQVAALGYA